MIRRQRSIRFPSGVIVRAASLSEREQNASWRDYGLYCDPAWEPEWLASVIDWPDFGVPRDPKTAARQIRHAFERATAGERVEIGCLGGLGRTGTVLACMAVLAGIPSSNAIVWVRRNYHPEAVETPEQEQWVAWFAERAPQGCIRSS